MISVHLTGTKNIGDEMCSPAHYLPGFTGRYRIKSQLPDSGVTVWGGGCIGPTANQLARQRPGVNIAFGIGSTVAGKNTKPPVFAVDGFDMAGVRDWPPPPGAEWVPCASVLSPLFDDAPEPTAKRVYYGHKLKDPKPQMNNDNMNFAAVIKHLASGEEVVTSSYHGMVWATLLGRKVTVHPFGGKFYGWPYEWGVRHDDALSECRAVVLGFWEGVVRCCKK